MNDIQTPEQPTTIVPVKVDTPDTSGGRDLAKGGFNLSHMEQLVSDCEDQPAWRERADVAAAYVDGKQLTELQEAALRAEGMSDVKPTNLIGRVVRGVLGQEARSRTDVRVEADEDEYNDLCDVFNVRMAEAKRETYADQAISNAYFGQVAPGIGWVEVARNSDVLDYPYRVMDVHRSEMWWDMRAKDILLRDARWVVRKRWQDLDELEAAMPQFKEIFQQVSNGWSGFAFDTTIDESNPLYAAYRNEDRWGSLQRRMDWWDSARKRIKLYEVWYKVMAKAVCLYFSPTHRVLFDPNNMSHVQAVNSGKVPIRQGLTRQVRMALYAGPHRLLDYGTKRRNFPYVPFIAYRDDEDNSPYGIVEGMIAPQDEYNARRIRINWLLRARQIIMDGDALDTKANTLAQVVQTVNRPDMTVILNENRKNKNANAFRVESNLALQREQVDVMQDAKQNIQDVPGVYGSQLGQAASGVTSGIANSLLIEQGTVAMGEINDNYRHARRMVYENLMDLMVEDHSTANMPVKIGRGSARRVVVLNEWDPQANEILNNTADAPLRVGLGEVPSTPAFRIQQQQQVAGIIEALAKVSPQAAAVMVPSFVESTDLPDRTERADDMRRVLGIPTAGDRKAAEQQQEQQAAEQAAEKELKQRAASLALDEAAAKVDKIESETSLNLAKVTQIGHDMGMASVNGSKPEPVAPPEVPEQETPEMAQERMIQEAIAEAALMRQQGAPMN